MYLKNIKVTDKIVLAVGLLFLFLFMIYPIVKVASTKQTSQEVDTRLKVCNNELLLDDSILLCRFIPVVGGDAKGGKFYNYQIGRIDGSSYTEKYYAANNYRVQSFLIGDIPVTTKLYYYVMEGRIFEENNANGVDDLMDVHTLEEWNMFIDELSKKTGRIFRLPSSFEWEYAARGGEKSHNYKYAGSDNIDEVAFYKREEYTKNDLGYYIMPHPLWARRLKPNELGLYDMSGSVWELTSSTIIDVHPSYKTILKNDPASYRPVVRGGNWLSPAENCLLDAEIGLNPPGDKVGLRLVLEF